MTELNLVRVHCTECAETRNIEACNVCRKPVCPSHRAGLGSLDDGYTCLSGCLFPGFGGYVQKRVSENPPLEKGEGLLVTLALVGIVAVLTLLAIYLIVEKPWLFG